MDDSRKSQRVRQSLIEIRREILELLCWLDEIEGGSVFVEPGILLKEEAELCGGEPVHDPVACAPLGTSLA